ncbi:hypothetical protein [Paludisphaera rhizosphaerae]|uniref:hypothetical protein n=1 Tax=Paludisphaera rhizosphaerae TaxID=2711216 RepID=UPI0013E9B37F|nr:hypothetical protein [Paludisphaera rhizosphaerae]
MKTTGPTSGYIAPEYRVACAAVVGIACGLGCALLQGAAETIGGPSILSSKVLPMAFCGLTAAAFLSRMGLRSRRTIKTRSITDDLLA